ncbi:MAG: carbonic anhydrase [Myxococcales bacterium]|nr:carbonic anhydrase [Myxococcales bacterium]
MIIYERIFENNRRWVEQKTEEDPDFFTKLARDQTPEVLYIGCADSRIPANEIMGLEPGEVFVHRNVANLVPNLDVNSTAAMLYAVEHLEVQHIIVCGHYGCGGIKAAMLPRDLGKLNPWLRNIRDVYRLHQDELDAIEDEQQRYDRLAELNVQEQCINVIKTSFVQRSFLRKGFPIVHGWIYNLEDGLLKDLNVDFRGILSQIQKIYRIR